MQDASIASSNIYQIVRSVIHYLLLSHQMFLRKRMKVHPTDEIAKSTRHPSEYVEVEHSHKVLGYRLNDRRRHAIAIQEFYVEKSILGGSSNRVVIGKKCVHDKTAMKN